MNKILSIILAIIIIVGGFYWFAKVSINNHDSYRSKILIEKSMPGYSMIKQFDTGISLRGFIVLNKKTNKIGVIFTSGNGRFIINGSILSYNPESKKLVNISQNYTNFYLPDKKAESMLNKLSRTNYIQQGLDSAPHKFYAVISLSCRYCHSLYVASQKEIKAGRISIRWVLVGKNSMQDKAKSIAILNSANPLKELKASEDNFDYKTSSYRSISNKEVAGLNAIKLDRNISVLSKFAHNLPLIVYLNSQGNARIGGGDSLPLDTSGYGAGSNSGKIKQFSALTSNRWLK